MRVDFLRAVVERMFGKVITLEMPSGTVWATSAWDFIDSIDHDRTPRWRLVKGEGTVLIDPRLLYIGHMAELLEILRRALDVEEGPKDDKPSDGWQDDLGDKEDDHLR